MDEYVPNIMFEAETGGLLFGLVVVALGIVVFINFK